MSAGSSAGEGLPLRPSEPSSVFGELETAETWWMSSPKEGRATILLSPESSPSNTFSAGTHTLPPGGQLRERCFSRGDFILLVLRGSGSVLLDGKRHSLVVGTSVAVGRGVAHRVANDGNGELELLWFSIPVGYERLVRTEGRRCTPGEPQHPGADGSPAGAPRADYFIGPSSLGGNQVEKGAVRIVQSEERTSWWQGLPTTGSVDVILSPYNYPSNQFSMGTQTLAPGAFIPAHSHSRNEEYLFVLDGRGSCSSSDGGTQTELFPGRALYVGRWAAHGLRAAEDASLTILWFFTPPGLEAVLAGLGRPRTPGEPAPDPFAPPPTIGQLFADAGFQPG